MREPATGTVGVLDDLADFDEQVESFLDAEIVAVAVIGDADAADQFHDEVRMAGVSRR